MRTGKPKTDKTWTSFKIFFAEEYHDLKEQNHITGQQGDYQVMDNHSANLTVNITDTLDNLAMVTNNDRNIIAQLTEAKLLSLRQTWH